MNIKLHKNIECTNGACGHTSSVIINPITQQATHLVVKDKSLPHNEHLIPIDWVLSTTYDSVHLSCSKEELAQRESFDKKQFIKKSITSYLTIPYLMHPYVMPKKIIVPEAYERVNPGALAVRRGARAEATDGYAGKVDEFLLDPVNGKITHLLLNTGHLFGKKKINVPVSQIDHIKDDVVYLKLDKHGLARLPVIPVCRCYIWHEAPVSEAAYQADKQRIRGESAIIKTLLNHLKSNNGLTRQYARKSLVAIGKPAVHFLMTLLNNRSHQVRWEAVKTLGTIRDPSIIDGLITALQDESFDVRWLAAEGLVSLGRQVLAPLLRALILQPDSGLLRESAHHILRSLIDDELEKKLKPVIAALEDIDFPATVPMAARRALKALA